MHLIFKYLSYKQIVMLLAAVALASCTQQVRVDGNWQEGVSRDLSFSKVLVVGIVHDTNLRCDFEHFMVTQIRATGAEASTSCGLMDTEVPLSRETIEPVVAEYGADAVLTTVLVQSQQGAKVGGKSGTRGGIYAKAIDTGFATYYAGGYGYYGVPVVYAEIREAPVVTTVEGEVNILSMLYDTRDATMVYEFNTIAQNLRSRDDALASISPAIAEHLQGEGLLRGIQ